MNARYWRRAPVTVSLLLSNFCLIGVLVWLQAAVAVLLPNYVIGT